MHRNVYNNSNELFNERYFSNIFYKKNKIRIVSFFPPKNINDKIKYLNTHESTSPSGVFGGDADAINTLHALCKDEFAFMLNNNVMNQEQYILYYLLCQNPDFFDYSIINHWDNLCASYCKNTTKVAICMSGNTRTFHLCKNNIYDNIINPLIKSGCHTNLFFSTWNDDDYKTNAGIVQQFCKKVESENYDAAYFNNYNSSQYLQFPGLCGDRTSANAASCHYKIKKSYELSEMDDHKHDIIIRLRPDIIYNNVIDIGNIKKALLNDYLFMPNSHGRYVNVTKFMMDHFFYGNKKCMDIIMKTFNNLTKYLTSDCPHTVEGFLYKNIHDNNVKIYRFNLSYGAVRKNNIYEKIYE